MVAAALAIPAALVSMIPSLHFDGWEWVVAALATPVVFWSGWLFHRSAWLNLRHGSTTMDTLVSMGSLSSWSWSAVVVAVGIGRGPHLLRNRGGDRHAHPAREVVRGPSQATVG